MKQHKIKNKYIPSGSAATSDDTTIWKYYPELSFLDPYVRHHKYVNIALFESI